MGLISAFTLIRAVSLFHITAAYFFLTAPKILSDQNVVFILGESMRIVGDVQTCKMRIELLILFASHTPVPSTNHPMHQPLPECCWHFSALRT